MPTEPGYASAVMRRREIDKLVCDNLRIPQREARRWLHTPIEQEDLIAEGSLGLVRAAQRYDPSRGPFPPFALLYVRSAIFEIVRARARRHSDRYGGFVVIVSLDERTEDGRDPIHEAADPRAMTDRIAENIDQIRLIEGLPEQERYALIRTEIDGASATEVSGELGISPHRVYLLVSYGATRLRRRAA